MLGPNKIASNRNNMSCPLFLNFNIQDDTNNKLTSLLIILMYLVGYEDVSVRLEGNAYFVANLLGH